MLLWLKSTFQVPGVGRLDQWWESHVPFRDRVSGGGGLGLHPGRLTAGTWKMEVWFRWFSFSKWVYFLLPAVNLPGCIFFITKWRKDVDNDDFLLWNMRIFLVNFDSFFLCVIPSFFCPCSTRHIKILLVRTIQVDKQCCFSYTYKVGPVTSCNWSYGEN